MARSRGEKVIEYKGERVRNESEGEQAGMVRGQGAEQ